VKSPRAPGQIETDTIHCLDAMEGLKSLPDASVDCVVTSPPYWSLRDYGTALLIWDGASDCDHMFESGESKQHSHKNKTTAGHPAPKEPSPAGTHRDSAFCRKCGAWRGSLGLEPTFDLYINHLITIFDEVHRVLKTSGTLWVNIGDTYAGSWGSYAPHRTESGQRNIDENSTSWYRPGYADITSRPPSSFQQTVPMKSACLIPARFVIAMAERGWIVRNTIVWHKPNPMPASVKDRFTCSWEHLFLFSKSQRYYFDLDAVRVPHISLGARLIRPGTHARQRPSHHPDGRRLCPNPGEPQSAHPLGKNPGDFWTIPSETRTLGAILGQEGAVKVPGGSGWLGHVQGGMARIMRELDPRWLSSSGKNPTDVWEIATRSSRMGHFAMFPEKLVERPILAGCPSAVCKQCGKPNWVLRASSKLNNTGVAATNRKNRVHRSIAAMKKIFACKCKHGFDPGIVLDPFIGAGTTAVVAKRIGRRFIGFELNPSYVAMANERIAQVDKSGLSNVAAKRVDAA